MLIDFLPFINSLLGTLRINGGEDDLFDQLAYIYWHLFPSNGSYSQSTKSVGMIYNRVNSSRNYQGMDSDCVYSNDESLKKKFNEDLRFIKHGWDAYLNK